VKDAKMMDAVVADRSGKPQIHKPDAQQNQTVDAAKSGHADRMREQAGQSPA
jgi:hypothetical protein